ncbi:isopentenyl phosphate kinase [Halobellus ruber]|uniref:Isopentenyl phosphate kinase n=1 Tax=Halobellus ruber TaxID=2761102 RepID=A0A7J9SE50_9EURY|nr:isopentenyl phosphate kinase family protein [Halobellus ruber]
MTVVLKLGGSVITDKETPETVDDDALTAAVDAIADADPDRLVVVHGGGSFGHVAASERGMGRTTGSRDAADVWAVHDAMRRLNDAVLDRLHDAGVPALPVHPLSVAARTEGNELSLPLDSTARLLGEGFVPVLHGDVVGHAGSGATIVSGDELVTRLAAGLDADRVGLCSTVPGVYDADGGVIHRITDVASVEDALGDADATDVTGGMAAKVRALLALDATAYVFGPASLSAFLAGESAGTVIDG